MMDEHERFLRKNEMLAKDYAIDDLDRKAAANAKKKGLQSDDRKEKSCYTCKRRNRCQEFRMKTTGGSRGSVSIGSETIYFCEKYLPEPPKQKEMSENAKKNLLKSALKGRL
ncbi:MAG: hypothetical protein ACLFQK_12005 [Fibrobacterota bacterium]